VTSSPDPSVSGQPVVFTAEVVPVSPGAGAPTGTVTFVISGGPTLTASVVDGTATVSTPALSVGSRTVTATYSGSPDFGPSADSDTHTVNRASTTTTVTSSPDPSLKGHVATFTAVVAPVPPGAGTPTGTVVFNISRGPNLTAPVVGGTATASISTLSPGSHAVIATYIGSTNFAPSTGADIHTVSQS
jgi:hypothetical protein